MYVPFSLFFFNCLQLSGTPNLGLFLTNVLGQQMARTRRLSETDGARAFSSLCGLCIFLHPRTHANAPKNSHPLRALIALSSRPVPILFPPCSVSRRPFFPISLARVVCTVFRFGRETMKSLSPMAIATNADRISRNRRPFLFLLLSLYINIYIYFFCLFGLHRSIRGFYRKRGTFDRNVLTATTRAPTRQNFPDSLRTPLITIRGPFSP